MQASSTEIKTLVSLFEKARKKDNKQGMEAAAKAAMLQARASAAVEEARVLAVFADAM